MIYRNRTGIIQGVTLNNRLHHYSINEYVPDEICPAIHSMSAIFEPSYTLYQHLLAFPQTTVNIGRSFALGDVIMAFVMCRWLAFKFPTTTFNLFTKTQYAGVFKVACDDVKVYPFDRGGLLPKSDYSINLDGIMEMDHQNGKYSRSHRIHTALTVLGFPSEELPSSKDINWSFHVGNSAYAFAAKWLSDFRESCKELGRKDLPLIAIQARGSHPVKSLPRNVLIDLVNRLSRNFNVVLIGNDIKDNIKMDGVRMPYNITINQTMAIIRRCNVIICMDSGPLWMAHVVKTPIVLISGPTYPEARISLFSMQYHYRVIRTERWINCQPCGERGEVCNRNFSCIRNVNIDMLADTCIRHVQDLINALCYHMDFTVKEELHHYAENNVQIRSILTNNLERIMDRVDESIFYLSRSASKFLLDCGYHHTIHHGDTVYDSNDKPYKIEVNDFGTWVIGAADKGRDENYHICQDRFVPAIEMMSAVVFIRNMGYNKLQQFNTKRIAEEIQCKYLQSICEKVLANYSEQTVESDHGRIRYG